MSGAFNGAQKCVSDLVGHNVPYIPCQAHRINTFIQHSCNASAIVSNLFDILENLYVFFTASTKRHSALHEELSHVENALQLRNLSKTRWTARAESVNAVHKSLEVIILVLEKIVSSEKFDGNSKSSANGLLKRVTSFDTIISLLFMKNILNKTKALTEILEKQQLNIIDAVKLIEATLESLNKINRNETEMNNFIDSAIDIAKKLNIEAEKEFQKYH